MSPTEMAKTGGKIVVLGAGSIGCYVGGALLAAGADVVLVGRARMHARVRAHGLLLTDAGGTPVTLLPGSVPFSEDPAELADADLVLVCVKSADTDAAAALIAGYVRPEALVLSLQNGVGNVDRLRGAAIKDRAADATTASTATGMSSGSPQPSMNAGPEVLAGMVPFNVVQLAEGRLHRGTAGELMVESSPRLGPWLSLFAKARLPLQQQSAFSAIQWGKLLINLNNAVNALAGIPLQQQFSQRGYRRCLAALIDEGRILLLAAGIRPAKVVKLGPRLLPHVLRLPDALFRRVAAPMLRIDPEARSSMWEDLEAGRRTEVDYLNGAIVALAARHGRQARRNACMVRLIRAAEQGERTPVDGDRLYRMLMQAG